MENASRQVEITWHESSVSHYDRCRRNGQSGVVIWFTGLSGSGKSTIAAGVEKTLFDKGFQVYRLDGDNVRHGLSSDLGFSDKDRDENIRRIVEVAALFRDASIITLVSFISPYRRMREYAKERIGGDFFVEVFVDASLNACRDRDVKGLYEKADMGLIENFTGISAPYEEPLAPDLSLNTEGQTALECVEKVIELLEKRGSYE